MSRHRAARIMISGLHANRLSSIRNAGCAVEINPSLSRAPVTTESTLQQVGRKVAALVSVDYSKAVERLRQSAKWAKTRALNKTRLRAISGSTIVLDDHAQTQLLPRKHWS